MQPYEKLGVFYLGRRVEDGRTTDEPVLYDARDLTTHAVCVGMTGSGKTGLCLALLEEAAIDGVPAIAIDPKGDIGNLLLTFPELRAEDFGPWIDPGEAGKHGEDPDTYAATIAARWREGLRSWGQEPERIARLRDSADFALYTPGSTAGRPLALLRQLRAPGEALRADEEALRERVLSSVSGLLALAQIESDPMQGREHILLSRVLTVEWSAGRDVALGDLIRMVQNPGFDRVGVLDLETFFPAAERGALVLRLNNLLASPGFAAWAEGEPLDVQRLLWTTEGKPRISVLSIAHLSDAERMFFVTLLLSEVVGWMRMQSGSSTLRALVYMDEVFGFFPPTANPPSKEPMLTLLKQARAFGLGVVLATQNPVDLDYKGLGNAGTWFLGRLQTERDKLRVLDGLESVGGAGRDRASLDALLSGLRSRIFLMHNVHEEEAILMETRWVMSYLRGPLSRREIRKLTESAAPANETASREQSATAGGQQQPGGERPAIPPGVDERFAPLGVVPATGASIVYRPYLMGCLRLHYADARRKLDYWRDAFVLAPLADGAADPWSPADTLDADPALEEEPDGNASYASLPPSATRAATWKTWRKSLETHAYRALPLVLYRCAQADLVSEPGETAGDFRARLSHRLHELRDDELEKLRAKYAPKLQRIEERIRKGEGRVERERSQHQEQKVHAAISFGTTLLGAVLGRRRITATNLGRAGATMRGVGRVGREKEDIVRAQADVAAASDELERLEAELAGETEELRALTDPANATVEEVSVAPRKSDIEAAAPVLVWVPWIYAPGARPRRVEFRAGG